MHSHTKTVALGWMCVVLIFGGPSAADTVVIAHTGQPVPGGNGTYEVFQGSPVLNDAGQISFVADLAGTSGGTLDDRAIYRADASGVTLICRKNWWTPTVNGRFDSLSAPAMNSFGQVVFRGDAAGTALGSLDAQGIYMSAGLHALDTVVRGNDPAPDGNGRFLVFFDPLIDDDVATTFRTLFTGSSGGLDDRAAVVVNGWGVNSLLAREGQTVPGGNGQIDDFHSAPAANDDQAVAITAGLRNTSGGITDDRCILRAQPGAPQSVLVREGDSDPDGNGKFVSFSSGSDYNNSGDGWTWFVGWLGNTSGGTDDDCGIYLAGTYGIATVAREGQTPPDGNGVFQSFTSDGGLNDTHLAFVALMRNTADAPTDERGIYLGNSLATWKIVRGGEASPDGNGVFRSFGGINLNEAGHVAFKAGLVSTASVYDDNEGLFISNGTDTVVVARKGDPMLGSTIVGLQSAGGPDCQSGFNEHAQVAYRAELADGRYALALHTPTIQWKGGPGSWYTLSHWTLNIQPASVHEVEIAPIPGPGPVIIEGPREHTEVKSLLLGAAGGEPVTLRLTDAGDLSAVGTLTVTHTGAVQIGDGRTLSAERIVNMGQIGILDGAVAQVNGLSGNGCSGPGTARLGGHIRPGMGIGTMTFSRHVVFDPDSATTHVELKRNDAWANDQIVVTGRATLGGVLSVELLGPEVPMPGESFEILRCGEREEEFHETAGLEGVGGYAGLSLELTYTPNGATLTAAATPGDATLDGAVNVFDLAVLGNNYQTGPGKNWMDADFTGEGDVNVHDLAVLANNYGRGTGGSAGLTASGESVPEPATLALLAVGGLALIRRKPGCSSSSSPRPTPRAGAPGL